LIEKYINDKKMLELAVIGQAERDKKLDNLKTDTADQVKDKIQGQEMKEFAELIEIGTKK
jgi:hypothetical protein